MSDKNKNNTSYLKNGSTMFTSGNNSFTSKGDQYSVLGGNLYKNGSLIAHNVSNEEAKGIIEGMNGGKLF